mmetsp:Transcript_23129/g.87527  ORF Transcript_23129/g.87527 Transcript_23129/m.87527 type:complete len:216 (+) Transcript_23129:1728-2375(+)
MEACRAETLAAGRSFALPTTVVLILAGCLPASWRRCWTESTASQCACLHLASRWGDCSRALRETGESLPSWKRLLKSWMPSPRVTRMGTHNAASTARRACGAPSLVSTFATSARQCLQPSRSNAGRVEMEQSSRCHGTCRRPPPTSRGELTRRTAGLLSVGWTLPSWTSKWLALQWSAGCSPIAIHCPRREPPGLWRRRWEPPAPSARRRRRCLR